MTTIFRNTERDDDNIRRIKTRLETVFADTPIRVTKTFVIQYALGFCAQFIEDTTLVPAIGDGTVVD